MKYSTKVSDAVHILLFIYFNPGQGLSSAAIAKSICTNPSSVRQLMAAMKREGLLNCMQGVAAPELARPIEEISLLDVYRAMEGRKPLLHLDTHTNPDCGVGVNIQHALQDCYDRVQFSAEAEMARIHLSDVAQTCCAHMRAVPADGQLPRSVRPGL